MKSFKFRLQAALKHRELLLELAQTELAKATEKLTLAKDLLNQCQTRLQGFVDAAPSAGHQFDPNQDLIRQRHIYQIREEIGRRTAMLKQLEELRQEKVKTVAEAHQNLKAMERLEEKDREAWKLDMKRMEQKELDEYGNRGS